MESVHLPAVAMRAFFIAGWLASADSYPLVPKLQFPSVTSQERLELSTIR